MWLQRILMISLLVHHWFHTWNGPDNGGCCCYGHTYGYHGRTGVDPLSEPALPEITGPFEIEAVVRVDDVNHADDRIVVQYSTVDVGDPTTTAHDVISLEVVSGSGVSTKSDLLLRVRPRGSTIWCTVVRAANVIVASEVATFTVSWQADGTTWIAKNGQRAAITSPTSQSLPTIGFSSCPLANVVRNRKLVGRNQLNSLHRFKGAILGVGIKNYATTNSTSAIHKNIRFVEQEYQNLPGQIFDQAFSVSFWARFDDFSSRSWQTLFDFSTSVNQDRICFGQEDNDNDRVEFYICRGLSCQSVDGSVESLLGTWSFWHVGVSRTKIAGGATTNTMFIQRNGVTLDDDTLSSPPNNVVRQQLLLGQSIPTRTSDSKFWGVILGLRVDIQPQ